MHPPRPLIAQDQRDSCATADDVRPGAQPGISPVLPPGVVLCRKRDLEHRAGSESSPAGVDMTGFAIALAALNEMKAAGVLRDYAVSGAMALVSTTSACRTS